MHEATLRVLHHIDKDDDGEPRSELWGKIKIALLPHPGDFIEVWHDDYFQTVVVSHIVHSAVSDESLNSEIPSLQNAQPRTEIITKWFDVELG